MSAPQKFASQMDRVLLRQLKAYAKATDRTFSGVLAEAVTEYLARAEVRPAFRKATEAVLEDHAELLRRLAK